MTPRQVVQAWAIAALLLTGGLALGLAIVYDRTQQHVAAVREYP